MKDIAYKHGIWSFSERDISKFDKNKLMLSLVEKLKSDVENNDPSDVLAQKMINDLLYHYCWKVVNSETNKDEN